MTLYAELLGGRFLQLPAEVRRLHTPASWSVAEGRCDVERRAGRLARLLCRLLGFPPTGADQPLRVSVELGRDGAETWVRNFNGSVVRSHRLCRDGILAERIGFTGWRFALEIDGPVLRLRPLSIRVLGLPLPRALWPEFSAVEWAANGRYWFDVSGRVRWLHLKFRYRGWLQTRGG